MVAIAMMAGEGNNLFKAGSRAGQHDTEELVIEVGLMELSISTIKQGEGGLEIKIKIKVSSLQLEIGPLSI